VVNGREAARSGEWAQHFSNASCFRIVILLLFHAFAYFSDANEYACEPKTTFRVISLFYSSFISVLRTPFGTVLDVVVVADRGRASTEYLSICR